MLGYKAIDRFLTDYHGNTIEDDKGGFPWFSTNTISIEDTRSRCSAVAEEHYGNIVEGTYTGLSSCAKFIKQSSTAKNDQERCEHV